jgi:hypothetical protein
MSEGLIVETFGESQMYVHEGLYTLDELKELVTQMEITNDRQNAAMKYLMGEVNE